MDGDVVRERFGINSVHLVLVKAVILVLYYTI
jgi:hypothetical protein